MPGHANATGTVSTSGAASVPGSVALAAGNGNAALLATSSYLERREIILKYGYLPEFAMWFQEESFYNYWNLNGLPFMGPISSDRRRALREQDKANKVILQV